MSDPSQNQDPGRLRKQYEDAIALNQQKDSQITGLSSELAVFKAGLGHLNDAQRGALVHVMGEQEVTGDNLKAAATALGFPLQAPPDPNAQPPAQQTPPPAQQGQQGQPGQQGDQGQQGQQPPQPEYLDMGPNSIHPDPRVAREHSITGLTMAEHASIMAQRGGSNDPSGSYEEALAKARASGDRNQVLAVIRQYGPQGGFVLESDLD